jgi:hypothetical protein
LSADADHYPAMTGSRRFSIVVYRTGAPCPGKVKTITSYQTAQHFSQLRAASLEPPDRHKLCDAVSFHGLAPRRGFKHACNVIRDVDVGHVVFPATPGLPNNAQQTELPLVIATLHGCH